MSVYSDSENCDFVSLGPGVGSFPAFDRVVRSGAIRAYLVNTCVSSLVNRTGLCAGD